MTASLLSRLSDNHPLHSEDDFHWAGQTQDALLSELKMLLMSRVRLLDIENIPLINSSVLNYGIDESFSKIEEINARLTVLETRLKKAVSRFEPRLTNVELTSSTSNLQVMNFILHANYLHQPVTIELRWDDCTGRFYFNE
ncbi:GPW/gp25 family protein [Enterobacter asburiae]|nr:GPW/gp25 family protein [Enterobacter asburiae]